jgi:5-(aminomethyl)-3-furanmethanol phosphate kinase
MVEIVVKVGGALLAQSDDFDAVLDTIGAAARDRRLLVVPGGGPFADAVRDVDRRLQLADETAHWMAVLAMDQYAHLLADRLARGVLVADRAAIADALDAGHVPVLAPFAWLRRVDPLPHSWDVTSDSIAAWIAGALAARRLVLVKPAAAVGAPDLVDPYFSRTLPESVTWTSVAADQPDALCALQPQATTRRP